MPNAVGFRTRRPAKQNRIVAEVRREIVEGKLAPGDRLPTRQILERRFSVSSATLQRALDRLIGDGLIYAKGSQGTFVADRPPFLSHCGLVFPFPDSPEKGMEYRWSRFWTALKGEAERMANSVPIRLSVYYADEFQDGVPRPSQNLLADIRNHRLAGLIFASPASRYRGTPLLETPNLPRVAFDMSQSVPGIPTMRLNGFWDRSLEYLAARGRRKVALIVGAGTLADPSKAKQWLESVRAHEMQTHARWMHGMDLHNPLATRNLIHLLMHASQQDRPDSILIGDDNLVEHATAGLVAAEVKVPDDVDVVAHCNFPWPTPSVLPVRRIGYDVRECLRACVAAIDTQRKGEPLPSLEIPARFEDEVLSAEESPVA